MLEIKKSNQIVTLGIVTRSSVDVVNCFVESNARHLSVYLCLSVSTTPLPLSCFKITMSSLFDRLDTISLYFYGTFAMQYFSHIFLIIFFILQSPFSGICDMSLKKL